MSDAKVPAFDLARMGAEAGFKVAAALRTLPTRQARRYHTARARQDIEAGAREIATIEGSAEMAQLFREGFEKGLTGGQLGLPVKILTPDGEIKVQP